MIWYFVVNNKIKNILYRTSKAGDINLYGCAKISLILLY